MNKIYSIIITVLVSTGALLGQFTFDNCQYAKQLQLTDGAYCSDNAAFNNVGATSDPSYPNNCVSLKFANGVWFSFVADYSAVKIGIFSKGAEGNMRSPKIVLFDDCTSLIECSPGLSVNADEFLYEKLIIGKHYLIMIESSVGGEGSFKICVNGYTPVPSPQSDCIDGVVLCDKSPFYIKNLTTSGNVTNEIEPGNCIQSETRSSWYKWTCKTSGTLTFVLTPNDYISNNVISDDLDFAVYHLPNGIKDCSGKILKRCMASGANGDGNGNQAPLSEWSQCNGLTGLRESENDISENPGCQGSSNNFVDALDMIAGQSYVLIVNNFSPTGRGFSIEFGGSGTFEGPEADFKIDAVQAFECDKTIVFTNLSSSTTDKIVNYTWGFGHGASPISSSNEGPINVIYDSFGDKKVALIIESEQGCLVTKLLDIYVEACCADTSTLGVTSSVTDLSCSNIIDGTILSTGYNGSPPYQYSLDGQNFQNIPIFYDLDQGDYNVTIQDKKGCEFVTTTHIGAPEPFIINAGPDSTIDLGTTIQIYASYNPITSIADFTWTPISGFLNCTDCLDPEITPPGTTTYILQGIDENGCIDMDTVTIYTKIVRPVIAPNIITPESRDENSIFTLSIGPAADNIKKLEIYDRWGNRVYSVSDIYIDTPYGWDGTFKGELVQPAVFAWVADVHFIDGVTLTYSGDITVIR